MFLNPLRQHWRRRGACECCAQYCSTTELALVSDSEDETKTWVAWWLAADKDDCV